MADLAPGPPPPGAPASHPPGSPGVGLPLSCPFLPPLPHRRTFLLPSTVHGASASGGLALTENTHNWVTSAELGEARGLSHT